MDVELEDLIDHNNTDNLDNFSYEPSAWEYVQNTTAIIFAIVGLISDIIIIYMIARNARMRSKTNLLLMNFIINDALFLVFEVHIRSAILELFGSKMHYSHVYNCVLEYTDSSFQNNECIFLLILVSNTLIKSKRIKLKTLMIVIYSIIVVNFIFVQVFCHLYFMLLLEIMNTAFMLVNFALLLFKEINNCYKKWYKKDPLSERTMFRINILRIYVGACLFTILCVLLGGFSLIPNYVAYILASNTYMIGLYVLLYIVISDKNFKICFLTLIPCKEAADYGVDDAMSENRRDGNQSNMNFNATENVVHSQFNDTSTIHVP